MRKLGWILSTGIVFLLACQDVSPPAAPEAGVSMGRSALAQVDVIVVLDPAFAPGEHEANQARASEIARGFGTAPRHSYGTALFGFATTVPEGRLNALERDPRVLYIERDGIASIPIPRANAPRWCNDPANANHPACTGEEGGEEPGTQTTPWGITRVGGSGNGSGKTAWIIDTGIDLGHADLNTSRNCHANFVTRGKDDPKDGHGHGTHVAGTVAAINNNADVVGVAANAFVCAVRVLDNGGSGTWEWVANGVDYVAANASSRRCGQHEPGRVRVQRHARERHHGRSRSGDPVRDRGRQQRGLCRQLHAGARKPRQRVHHLRHQQR